MHRRDFLKVTVLGGVAFSVGSTLPRLLGASAAGSGPYGALGAADANGLQLPAGFESRVVATSGVVVPGTTYQWHTAPDGGACFPTSDGGWVYVSNSEVDGGGGGVGMVRFDPTGQVVGARRILSGTNRNCAGGATPWGTWLSCEETATGRVWECDPLGATAAVVRPAMGTFNHEAAAVDPVGRAVYLTEDSSSGALYRFRPAVWGDLSAGTLEVLTEVNGQLAWRVVPDPDGAPTPTRSQVAGTKTFSGGEGAWYDSGKVYFTTKGDNRVWTYEPAANRLAVVYDAATSPTPVLTGVDNVTVARSGDVYVAEDGGNMELVLLSPDGGVAPFLRCTASGSELTGPAFDPSGTRLYLSSQRNPGRTFEVKGPFRTSTAPPTSSTTTTTTAAPGISLTAVGSKVKGRKQVDLRWTGAVGNTVRGAARRRTGRGDGQRRRPPRHDRRQGRRHLRLPGLRGGRVLQLRRRHVLTGGQPWGRGARPSSQESGVDTPLLCRRRSRTTFAASAASGWRGRKGAMWRTSSRCCH